MSTHRLEDRAAIMDQMFRYARATDWLETENHRLVFMEDCVFATPHSGDLLGADAVVEYMNRVLPQFEATQHLIGNIWVEFTGPETANAVSYVRAWHRWPETEQKPDMILWGEYHDTWVLLDGTWRISERRVREAGIEPRRGGGVVNRRRAQA
jgi:hypothetical protein